ncbi:MAG: hypothetical protein ACREBI_10615 [Nitrosotalea sp.]
MQSSAKTKKHKETPELFHKNKKDRLIELGPVSEKKYAADEIFLDEIKQIMAENPRLYNALAEDKFD